MTDSDSESNTNKDIAITDNYVVQTSGFIDDIETTPEKGDFEIGIHDGEGYIKLPIFPNGDVMEFPTPAEAVREFAAERERRHPTPTLPDSVDRQPSVQAPPEWTAGAAVHTGGGIFCRRWETQRDGYTIELIYNIPEADGIGINLYGGPNGGEWIGEIHIEQFDSKYHDKEVQPRAVDLMENVTNGAYDDKLTSLID